VEEEKAKLELQNQKLSEELYKQKVLKKKAEKESIDQKSVSKFHQTNQSSVLEELDLGLKGIQENIIVESGREGQISEKENCLEIESKRTTKGKKKIEEFHEKFYLGILSQTFRTMTVTLPVLSATEDECESL